MVGSRGDVGCIVIELCTGACEDDAIVASSSVGSDDAIDELFAGSDSSLRPPIAIPAYIPPTAIPITTNITKNATVA